MSTTFAELSQLSATLSGTGELRLGPNIKATLDGVGAIGVNGIQTMGVISGGVTYHSLYASLDGVGAVSLDLKVRKPLQATLAGTGAVAIGQGGVGSMVAFTGFASDRITGTVNTRMEAFTGEATGALPTPSFALADTVFMPLLGESTGLTGEIGSATTSLAALQSFASNKPYGGVISVMAGFQGAAHNAYTLTGPLLTTLFGVGDSYTPTIEYGVTVTDEVDMYETLTRVREIVMAIADTAAISDPATVRAEFSPRMSEVISIISDLQKNGAQLVWVVNTESGANWTYRGWDFNSYMAWQGKYYAAGESGFYELTGDTDNGAPIVSSILTGNSDLGTVQQKRMAYVYVGASSNSDITMIVHTDDGQTNEYVVTARDLMQNSRTAIGKGLRSKYWQIELTNADGGDFELESLELAPDALIRRV